MWQGSVLDGQLNHFSVVFMKYPEESFFYLGFWFSNYLISNFILYKTCITQLIHFLCKLYFYMDMDIRIHTFASFQRGLCFVHLFRMVKQIVLQISVQILKLFAYSWLFFSLNESPLFQIPSWNKKISYLLILGDWGITKTPCLLISENCLNYSWHYECYVDAS